MERDDFIVTENSTETQEIQQEFEEEEKSFEISDEARAQSRKFFKFNDKPKKEKRKFESFEIVKTYTPKEKPKKDNEFDKILETTNESIVSEESLSVKSTNQKAQVKMKLRPQGKLVLIVIAFCVILLSSLIINNAITINKLNESIDNLNNQITVTDFNIDKAVKNLQELDEDSTSTEIANELGLEQNAETFTVDLYERKDVVSLKPVSNWFDKLCNFLAKLFGG